MNKCCCCQNECGFNMNSLSLVLITWAPKNSVSIGRLYVKCLFLRTSLHFLKLTCSYMPPNHIAVCRQKLFLILKNFGKQGIRNKRMYQAVSMVIHLWFCFWFQFVGHTPKRLYNALTSNYQLYFHFMTLETLRLLQYIQERSKNI